MEGYRAGVGRLARWRYYATKAAISPYPRYKETKKSVSLYCVISV